MIGIRHGFNLSAYLHICPAVALLKKEKEKKKVDAANQWF